MNLSLALGASLGLENIDVDINIGEQPEVDANGAALSPVTPAGTLTPEAAEVEAIEADAEVEEVAEEEETVSEDVEALESYKGLLTRALESGRGLDIASFEMFQISTNHIYKKYGIDAGQVFPSMESFGSDSLAATQVSLEKVEISLETLGSKAGELWKKFIQGVKNFFSSLWQKLFPSMATRAEAIKAKVTKNDTKFDIAPEKEYAESSLLHYITADAKTSSDIVAGISGLRRGLFTSLEELNVDALTDKEWLDAKQGKANALVRSLAPNNSLGFLAYMTGNGKLNDDAFGAMLAKAGSKYKNVVGSFKKSKPGITLKHGDIAAICDEIIVWFKDGGRKAKEFTKTLDKLEVAGAKAGETDEQNKERRTQEVAKKNAKAFIRYNNEAIKYLTRACKTLLDYVNERVVPAGQGGKSLGEMNEKAQDKKTTWTGK